MREPQYTYDWAAMLDDLYAAGLSAAQIAKTTSIVQTHRAIEHYRRGAQPLYWRGKALLELWCAHLRRKSDDAPTAEIRRGIRVKRELIVAPRLQNLPAWPGPKKAKRQKAAA